MLDKLKPVFLTNLLPEAKKYLKGEYEGGRRKEGRERGKKEEGGRKRGRSK